MIYNTSYAENLHSYVNNINTHEGGTHLSGFRRGLTHTLKKYADESGMLDKLKFDIAGDDFREGLTAIISVKVQEPPSRKALGLLPCESFPTRYGSAPSHFYACRVICQPGRTSRPLPPFVPQWQA